MTKAEVENIYRWRKTLVQNFDNIIKASKSSKKADLSSQGQLDLFSMGMEDVKTNPKLIEYDGVIDLMELVNVETELLGIPVLYDPLEEYSFYVDIYCTHTISEILELTDKTENIIIIDRLSRIEHKISAKGNKYCKLFFLQFGETYIYLWGNLYKDKISMMYVNEIYMIQLNFNTPTKEFDRYSHVCTHIKNVKDVDIDSEYKRLIKSLVITDELNENWMIKNMNYE